MKVPMTVLRVVTLGPALLVSFVLAVVVFALLPPALGLVLFLASAAVLGALALGQLEEVAIGLLTRSRPATEAEFRVMAPVLAELGGRRVDVGSLYVRRVQRPQTPVALAIGHRAVVITPGLVEGPGAVDLMTIAGRDAIAEADVVVIDRLAPWEALTWARPDAEIVDVAKIPFGRFTSQEEINRILVDRALAGHHVVRLKGGDSFVFGRGHEELEACREAGVPARVIPGVTSSIAVPEAVGIPVTHRGLTQGFTVVSGHVPPGHPDSSLDYAALARCGTTLVFLMGVGTLDAITAELCAVGMDPATPAAMIADGTHPHQRVITASLASIAEVAHDTGIRAPAVVVIGQVVSLRRTGSP